MMSLTSKVLPSMKNRQIGHIVAVSAICGIIGFPFNSIYSASKFAVEGYCESLREELKDFCINLTLVEPGPVFTHFDQKSVDKMADKDIDSTTKKLFETFMQKNNDSYQTMGQTPEEVAVQIRQLIEHGKSEQLCHYTNPIYTNALSQVYREEVFSS
ncbi:retinol dehydrogenase 8-like [Hydractinia symbiolongicarpus]|uniref:retinol dehydrogenase 8-like n=1 Tax=Hydractinia symbiolongicarpus TaxID=13093 RepID=UPI00254C3462|nr:retinol dehydrogenase 8-like [Hydractinia symbiolongicarpus]